MKKIPVQEAVGHVLCHDMTQIIRGSYKDARFRKGHVVTEEDVAVLLSMGKESVYIYDKLPGMLHEDEAVLILRDISLNEGMSASKAKEGKISIKAERDGLFTIRREALLAVNSLGDMMIASRHSHTPIQAGDELATTRVIPLIIPEEKMKAARKAAGDGPIFSIEPFVRKKAGIIATGSEIYHGRIKDNFTPVIIDKLAAFDIEPIYKAISNDTVDDISSHIDKALAVGCDMIVCTGGMSVDPDDRTPAAIKSRADRVVTYGAPVLPGAMFMLAYHKSSVPIMGLPGCVMYSKRTIFDLVLPYVAADQPLDHADFAAYGEGGLCLNCKICTYPNCGFGKGSVVL